MSTSSIMQETIRRPSRLAAVRDRRGLALAGARNYLSATDSAELDHP